VSVKHSIDPSELLLYAEYLHVKRQSMGALAASKGFRSQAALTARIRQIEKKYGLTKDAGGGASSKP
jgi:hypothetical protein